MLFFLIIDRASKLLLFGIPKDFSEKDIYYEIKRIPKTKEPYNCSWKKENNMDYLEITVD